MRRQGQDSFNSWMITAGLAYVSMILYAVVRLSGVLFVASMSRFGVDRTKASLPYILTDFVQAISSPLTGYLASKFGARLVMALGCFISGIGIASCFFAEEIETVTILWGLVLGIGFGLSVPLLALVITQHFVRKRAIAMGIVYFGGYVGFSILPGVAELMIQKYGLSGTFLLIAGIMLNCIPVALLLRKPKVLAGNRNRIETTSFDESDLVWSRNGVDGDISIKKAAANSRNDDNSKGVSNNEFEHEKGIKSDNLNAAEYLHVKERMRSKNSTNCFDNMKHSDVLATSPLRLSRNEKLSGVANYGFEMESEIERSFSNEKERFCTDIGSNTINSTKFQAKMGHVLASSSVQFTDSTSSSGNEIRHNHPIVNSSASKDSTQCIRVSTNEEKKPTPKLSKLSAFKVFLEPVYLIVLVAEAVFEGSFIAFVTILVDFSLDVGIPISDTKYITFAFGIASNVGLVSFGWVTDNGHLSLTNFTGVLLVLRCATCAFIPFSNSLPVLVAAVALHGLVESPLSNLLPLIIAEYYAPEVHEVAITCRLFLCAPVYLVTPTLIGYFRDGLGSYFYLFLMISISSFMCGVMSFLAPRLSNCRCGRDESILRKRSH